MKIIIDSTTEYMEEAIQVKMFIEENSTDTMTAFDLKDLAIPMGKDINVTMEKDVFGIGVQVNSMGDVYFGDFGGDEECIDDMDSMYKAEPLSGFEKIQIYMGDEDTVEIFLK